MHGGLIFLATIPVSESVKESGSIQRHPSMVRLLVLPAAPPSTMKD